MTRPAWAVGRGRAALTTGLLSLAWTGPGSAQATSPFEYRPNLPVPIHVGAWSDSAGFAVAEVTYPSTAVGRVPAVLYRPDTASGAAILLQHGIPGNRYTLHRLAAAYARAGVVVLSVAGPWVRTDLPWRGPRLIPAPLLDDRDADEVVLAVKDLRRALDVLTAIEGVDPRRLAFVGHSFGATMGALLSGVDPRLGAVVLMAPSSGWSRWMRLHLHEHMMGWSFRQLSDSAQAGWLARLDPYDARHWIARAGSGLILIQAGLLDRSAYPEDVRALHLAVPASRVHLGWYRTGHLLGPAAFVDQAAFLAARLGFDPRRFEAPPAF